MLRKTTILCLLAAVCPFVMQAAKPAPLSWRENITMLVVPREQKVVKAALDLTRYSPLLVVCYQHTAADPVLHAWNGTGWVSISAEDYISGTFFTVRPQHIILVDQDKNPAPESLIPDGTWCKKGHRISTTDRRILLHLVGRHLNLPYRFWLQLTKRHGLTMEQINPSLENIPWPQRRGFVKNTRLFDDDMANWQPLMIAEPQPIEPIELEVPETVEPAETPAEEPAPAKPDPESTPETQVVVPDPVDEETIRVEEIMLQLESFWEPGVSEDPFSTDDIPPAELLTAPVE